MSKLSIEDEIARLKKMNYYEEEAYANGARYIAGIDEVGRGALAGPVLSAAVILSQGDLIEGIDDSKKLSPVKREKLFEQIAKRCISYGVGLVSASEIDEIGIVNAVRKSMKMAVQALKISPDFLLIDAEDLSDLGIKKNSIIKGDQLSISIAAASIVAKVTRDKIMVGELNRMYPKYGFSSHKGYGTKQHVESITKYGLSDIHRVSFTKRITLS